MSNDCFNSLPKIVVRKKTIATFIASQIILKTIFYFRNQTYIHTRIISFIKIIHIGTLISLKDNFLYLEFQYFDISKKTLYERVDVFMTFQ